MKVAVIGNAPNLSGAKLGESIDKCDKIVRFNDFRIQGFEEDLGSKTTHWCVSAFAVYHLVYKNAKPCDANLGGIGELWVQKQYFNSDGNVAKFVMKYAGVTVDNVRTYNEEIWNKYMKNFGTTPSNGFMGVMTAMEVFKKAQIFIAGFGDGAGHYYDPEHPRGGHNFEKENDVYKYYVKLGDLHFLGE